MLKGRLGLEGARVPHSDRHGLMWLGRGQLTVQDGTLRFATAGYAVKAAAQVAVAAAGAVPELGFIHEESGLAFALDIADLFREQITLPIAFGAVKDHEQRPGLNLERVVRRRAVTLFRKEKLISRMIDRIQEILPPEAEAEES